MSEMLARNGSLEKIDRALRPDAREAPGSRSRAAADTAVSPAADASDGLNDDACWTTARNDVVGLRCSMLRLQLRRGFPLRMEAKIEAKKRLLSRVRAVHETATEPRRMRNARSSCAGVRERWSARIRKKASNSAAGGNAAA